MKTLSLIALLFAVVFASVGCQHYSRFDASGYVANPLDIRLDAPTGWSAQDVVSSDEYSYTAGIHRNSGRVSVDNPGHRNDSTVKWNTKDSWREYRHDSYRTSYGGQRPEFKIANNGKWRMNLSSRP